MLHRNEHSAQCKKLSTKSLWNNKNLSHSVFKQLPLVFPPSCCISADMAFLLLFNCQVNKSNSNANKFQGDFLQKWACFI